MFNIYLPIAEVYINVPFLLFISTIVGFLTGLLGIGGGFLMTPILIFLGIPPVYAVANGANNILAASVSGALAHYFKNHIDVKMGILILIGGLVGVFIGVEIFSYLIKEGSIDRLISISYFILLSAIGLLMFYESLSEIRRIRNNKFIKRRLHQHYYLEKSTTMHEFYRCVVTFCVDVVVVAVASGGKTDDDDCDFYCCCFFSYFFLLSRWWRRRRKRDGCKTFDKNYFCYYLCSYYQNWLCSSSCLFFLRFFARRVEGFV